MPPQKFSQKTDKSNWIASLTAISGCLNGSLGCESVSLNEHFLLKSDCKKRFETVCAEVAGAGFKVIASVQNTIEPAGTQEIEPENVVKVFK